MTKLCLCAGSLTVGLILSSSAFAQVERIWLTHRTNNPSKLVVNWTTKSPGDSTVLFGKSTNYGEKVSVPGSTKLHHIEIPLTRQTKVHYSVRTGEQVSADAVFNGYPVDELRVAVVADWQSKPELGAIENDKIHLLMTAGDNIPNLYGKCGLGTKDCTRPYEELIDAYPQIFQSIPFMPVPGNHDHQIRPRGDVPPVQPVYDINATAFCKFFSLPDDKWKWHFDVPGFQVRFVGLDLNHIHDLGTTWQSCHDYRAQSAQFRWYEKLMSNRPAGYFVVTLHNEHNRTMSGQVDGAWGEMFRKGNLVISGSGYYAEREVFNNTTYVNTSLARPLNLSNPKGRFHANEPSYVLMRFQPRRDRMTVELKNLDGEVLDRRELTKRKDR